MSDSESPTEELTLPRAPWKPKDPLLAFLVGALVLGVAYVLLWLPIAIAFWQTVPEGAPVYLRLLLAGTLAYPVGLVSAIVVTWWAYRRGRRSLARTAAAVPFLWIVPSVLLVLYAGIR